MRTIIVLLLFLLNTGIIQADDKREIVIETYVNNAPFSRLNENREIEGYCIDVSAAIMDELGRDYRHKKTALCQKRIYSDSEKLDVMSFVTKADIMDGWYLSRPYLTTQYRIVHRKGEVIDVLDDLIYKDIVIITGRYSNTHLSTYGAKYIPEVIFMSDVTEGLRLLSSRHVDIAIILQGSNERLEIDEEFDDLVIYENALPVREYCFASKDSMLIKDLNRAIDVLKADNSLDAIYGKWFLEISDKNTKKTFNSIIIIILVVSILVLLRKIQKSGRDAKFAKTVMQKYEKTLNCFSHSYIKIFLTDLKHNERSILKKKKYKLIENGLALFFESIHPDDREFYTKERQKFLSSKKTSTTIRVRLFDTETNKHHFYELVLNPVARDKAGNVYKFTTISRNETLQDEMIYKQSKDIHNLNMAMKSVRLIRWEMDSVNATIHFINIDGKEYVYTNKELIKKIASKDYKQLRRLIAQINSEKNIDTIRMDVDLFDTGDYQTYEIMTTVERDDDDSLYAIYGIIRDVTEMKKHQELLHNEILHNKIISMYISVGIAFYDKDGVCRSMNTKALELLDFDEKKVLNTEMVLDFQYISEEAREELSRGGSVTYQVTNEDIRKRYKKFCIEIETGLYVGELISVNCSSVFNNDNELIGYVSVYTDITDITRSREDVIELKTRLELALEAGGLSAWTYRTADEAYMLLNSNESKPSISDNLRERIERVHPDDINIITNAFNVLQRRQSYKETVVIRTTIDNKLITNRVTIIPREQDGELKHIIGATKNISEEMERALELKNVNTLLEEKNTELVFNINLLNEIIERLPGAVYIKDINSDLKYYLANTNYCDIIGAKTMSEIIGFTDAEILPKEIGDSCRVSDIQSIEINRTVEIDEEVTFGGVKSIYRTVKTPIALTNGMKLLICMSLDVTEIYRMKEKAEQSDKLKTQFLENISHEIRTPLNAIVGFSSMLLCTEEEETRQEFNDIITANSDLLINLINDILDLSKMESGVVMFNDEFFNVNALLEETYLSFSMRASQQIEIKYEKIDESVSAKIDIIRIRQVLNNYLSNALKFTESGEVVFGCKVERGGLKLFVKDTGIGIAEENKAKVFRRFEKFDTFAQGTGLGLSICKAFADQKEGEVGFESVLGEGSNFWIWIPCEIKT